MSLARQPVTLSGKMARYPKAAVLSRFTVQHQQKPGKARTAIAVNIPEERTLPYRQILATARHIPQSRQITHLLPRKDKPTPRGANLRQVSPLSGSLSEGIETHNQPSAHSITKNRNAAHKATSHSATRRIGTLKASRVRQNASIGVRLPILSDNAPNNGCTNMKTHSAAVMKIPRWRH